MTHRFIDEIKENLETSLPTSSAIVAKVIQTAYNASSGAKDLAEIIEHDPPLTAKILKVANSAYYGAAGTITSLQRAIVILGFETIKRIVTTVGVIDSFSGGKGEDGGIDLNGIWYHSVGTARACELISEKTAVGRPDATYIAGLLHDIGKIILAISFPDNYRNVIEQAVEGGKRILFVERKLLNVDHAMIGKILCDVWNLPEEIGAAILYHHDPTETSGEDRKLAQVAQLGDFLCRKARIGFPGDELAPKPPASTLALLGTKVEVFNDNFNQIFQMLNEEKKIIEGFFRGIETGSFE